MKGLNMKILVIAAILVLYPVSWYKMYSDSDAKEQQYNTYLETAREKSSMGIVKIAKENYDACLAMKDSYSLRLEVARMYKDNNQMKDYREMCENLISNYPRNIEAYDYLAEHYYTQEQYRDLYKLQDTMTKYKIASDTVNKYCEELQYQYEFVSQSYLDAKIFEYGYAPVKNKYNTWGYVNENGNMVISCVYDRVGFFNSDGLAGVSDTNGTYIIDTTNAKLYVDPQKRNITYIGYITGDVFPIVMDGKYYVCNLKFTCSEASYDFIGSFNNGKAAAKQGTDWFFIDTSGNKVDDKVYEDIKLDTELFSYSQERAFVKMDGVYKMIDINGNVVGDSSYEDAYVFYGKGATAVKVGNQWGYIDTEGKEVIAPQYQEARPFVNDYAAVYDLTEWKFITTENKVVLEGEFEDVTHMTTKGTALVKKEGSWRLLSLIKYNH